MLLEEVVAVADIEGVKLDLSTTRRNSYKGSKSNS